MQRLTAALAILLGVPLLVAIPVGLVVGLGIVAKWILVQFFAMKPDALQVWLPAVATLLAGGVGVLVTKRFERKHAREQRQQDVRARIYDPVMQMALELVDCAQASGTSAVPERFGERLTEAGRLLLMGGSDGVVTAFAKLREFDYENGSLEQLGELVAKLILLLRIDLGHESSTVGKGTIMKLMRVEAPPQQEQVTKQFAGLAVNIRK